MKKLIIAAPILSGILWGSTGLFVRSLAGMGHEQSHNHVQPRLFSDVHAPDRDSALR